MSALNTLIAEVGLKPDFHTATIRNMADSGGHNPSATLLSENPGVDLKMFAGGGMAGADAAGGYDNSATLLRAPADPVPVLKFSGGGDDFDFVEDVLGLTQQITELQGITTLQAIKELSEDTLKSIYDSLLADDIKFAEFLKTKGLGHLITEEHKPIDTTPPESDAE